MEFTWHEFNGQHAFMRDEGPRYDPELSRLVGGEGRGTWRVQAPRCEGYGAWAMSSQCPLQWGHVMPF